MNLRRLRTPVVLVTLAALATGTGCGGGGIFNPSLFVTVGGSPLRALDQPDGSIIILVMNLTDATAAARIRVTKENGGVLVLTVPVAAFESGVEPDHVAVVQDCDIASIQLLGVTSEDGVDIPSFSPPIRKGFELSCGKVVAITILGIFVEPVITVY
jgi:hypothetical protein